MDSTHDTAGPVFGRDISARGFRRGLVWLFLLGLITRAGYLVEHARSPSFGVLTLDQKYFDTAARLLAGGGLRHLHGLRPLLYPMFLAACYKLGGAHGIDLAVAAQHLFGVLTGLLAAALGARLFRHRAAGLAGGALYLLAPVPLCFEGELLVESTYTFLICLGLLLAIRAAATPGGKGGLLWLLCGALTVLTAQERPNILVFMAVFPLLAGWRWWHSRQGAALLPLLTLLGAAAMAVPWGFVNKIQMGRFQVIPSAGGVNLYFGNRRGADGMQPEQGRRVTYGERYEDSGEVWAREEYEAAMRAAGRQPDTNPMAVSKYWTHRALDEIKADPAAWMGLMARKCWLLFWNAEIPNNKSFAFLQTEFAWLRYLPVRWVVLLMLAPAGIWAAAKAGRRGALFIVLGYVLLYCAANTLFFICDRYRYPVWPAMAAMAGGGALAFIEAARKGRGWGMVLGMAAMATLSLPNWFHAQLPSFARDYLFRSIAWYEKGHFQAALADVNNSLALDPGEATALHHKGNVLLALGRFDEAAKDYEQTLKDNSPDAGVWNDYGLALDALGRSPDALQAFQRAMDCHPPSRNAFFAAALEQIKLGRLDDAANTLERFETVYKEDGPDATALAIRSVLARRRGNNAEADQLEARARALDPAAVAWVLDVNDRKSSLVLPPQ